jgi:hypothetical protein
VSTGARNIFAHCLTNTSDVIANDERRTVDLFNAVDVERADREIDRFIERRHQETNAKANAEQQNIEALWKESTQRAREKRRRENAAAWYGHMRELHSSLAAEHEARARALLGGGGA